MLGSGFPEEMKVVGAASAAKLTPHQIADQLLIPALSASRLTPLLHGGGSGNDPAEHGAGSDITVVRAMLGRGFPEDQKVV